MSEQPTRREQLKGAGIALAGVLLVAPDATCIHAVQPHSHNQAFLFWKYFFVSVLFSVQVAYQHWGSDQIGLANLAKNWHWLLAVTLVTAFTWCLNQIGYTMTTAASALALNYTSTMFSCIFGWFLLQEPLHLRTVLAVLAVSTGIVLVFLQDDGHHHNGVMVDSVVQESEVRSETATGDFVSFCGGLGIASTMVLSRFASVRAPEVPLTLGMAPGSLITALVGLSMAGVQGVSVWNPTYDDWPFFWPVVMLNAAGMFAFWVTIPFAALYLSMAELSFYYVLDAVFSPILVYLFFGELPRPLGMVGAGLMLAAVLIHEAAGLMQYEAEAISAGDTYETTIHNEQEVEEVRRLMMLTDSPDAQEDERVNPASGSFNFDDVGGKVSYAMRYVTPTSSPRRRPTASPMKEGAHADADLE